MEGHTVRRCRRCREPAVIVVDRWEARLLGVLPLRHSERTDHQCQSCGARFSLQPMLLLWFGVGVLIGANFLGVGALSIVGALIALFTQGAAESMVLVVVAAVSLAAGLANLIFLAGPQVHSWWKPVVPGTAKPGLRQVQPLGLRQCSCGGHARRISQRAHIVIRFPAGTDATHLCFRCGREFVVSDRLALVIRFAMALFLGGTAAGLAALLPFRELKVDHFVVLGVLALGALGAGLWGALGMYRRFVHPAA